MALFGDLVTNQPLPFSRWRRMFADLEGMQSGVVASTAFRVGNRAAGANMSVDVQAGAAWIGLTSGGFAPTLGHAVSDAVANIGITAANGSNPRLDQLVLYWNDSGAGIGIGGDVPTLGVLTGGATAGVTLDNRAGALALPANCLRLADILVPMGATSIVGANIRDRRPWARGAFAQKAQSGLSASTTPGAQGIGMRVELNGNNVWRVTADGILTMNTANQALNWGMSAAPAGSGYSYLKPGASRAYRAHTTSESIVQVAYVTSGAYGAGGSMLFAPYLSTTGGVGTLDSFQMTVEEITKSSVDQA